MHEAAKTVISWAYGSGSGPHFPNRVIRIARTYRVSKTDLAACLGLYPMQRQ